jgi:tetraacyldisaccharide 4'-kinase
VPSIEGAWEGLCRRRGLLWCLVLLPLSWAYGLISAMLRMGRPRRVQGLKVISVGNLSMGGSGKTPLVLEAARMLKGRKLAVISRGYGADEGAMLEASLPWATTILDPDRLRGAREALGRGCEVVILDDGFQRRHQLWRDLDILVLDWERRDLERHCLPAGRLREPLRCAAQAQAVVVTHAPLDWNCAALRRGLPRPFRGLRVFRADHEPQALRSLAGSKVPLAWLKGRQVTAMSGIGRPSAFEATLRSLGAEVSPLRFSDHHAYRSKDLPAQGPVVTTAKDAVKLGAYRDRDIWVLEMRMRIVDAKEFALMLRP